jgi:hypothetical protein
VTRGGRQSTPLETFTDIDGEDYHPFAEFRRCGLLWLANTAAFNPRGYTVRFHYATREYTTAVGWSMAGDGVVPWHTPVVEETIEMMRRSKEIMP